MLQKFWNEQPITAKTKDDMGYVNLKKTCLQLSRN